MKQDFLNSELLDRVRPNDQAAERGVIGSLILDPRRLADVAPILRPEDFYAEAHQVIYQTLLAMDDAGQGINTDLLVSRLSDAGDLERAGGAAHLYRILSGTPIAAHAIYYAKIVATKSAFRRLIDAGCDLVQRGYAQDGEPDQAVDAAERTLQAAWRGEHDRGPRLIRDTLPELIAHLDQIQRGEREGGYLTGLETLDRNLGGLFPGELFVVAARPGMGKTAIGCQIAWHFATHDRPVYFVSLEMSAEQLLLRVLCSQASVSTRLVRTGAITTTAIDRLVRTSNALAGAP